MADAENISPQEKKIIRQIEYYFGDFNLPRDKFLNEETKTDEGWVTMETMLKFKRLSEISTDEAEIVGAIKKSKAGLIAVGEDGKKIRRDPAIPLPENTEESRKALEARTAYAKGFDKENSTLDELLDYFNETNPNVVSIQMRNWADKKGKEKIWHFKGSIFITFKTEEAATEFVESKDFKYKDGLLDIKFQKKYFEEKAKENEARKKGKGNKKDNNAKQEVREEKVDPRDDITLPKGATFKITGLGGEITREDIKEVLAEKFSVNIDKDGGDIAFVTYEKGEAEAKIRFKIENFAKPIAKKWAGMDKMEVKGTPVVGSLLEGEEEEKFLADSVQDLKNRRNKNRTGHKRRGGFSHGRGAKRGRR
eukprot:GFUD01022681.1.p1 GENE.GFUD01022681.1~~GFUD01022681.1.p1  ORF type:complete len:365 (-),score=119.75 GFUD01022681.1:155-1249(-)